MCDGTLYSYAVDPCYLNLPGVTELKYTLVEWIDTFPAIEDYDAAPTTANPVTLAADITFDTVTYTTAQWHSIEIAIDQNKTRSEVQGPKSGEYYVSTLEGFVSSGERLPHWIFKKTMRAKVLFATLDRNNQWRVWGTPNNPARLYANHDSGAAAGDSSGFEVRGFWDVHGDPAPFYDGVFS